MQSCLDVAIAPKYDKLELATSDDVRIPGDDRFTATHVAPERVSQMGHGEPGDNVECLKVNG